jgi:hypothetical protein
MEEVIFMPPFQTPVKAKYGSPCTGCGWCCHSEVCKIGKHFFGEDRAAPCPAIMYKDGKVRCGIVMAERELLKTDDFGTALGIGQGCCADDPS